MKLQNAHLLAVPDARPVPGLGPVSAWQALVTGSAPTPEARLAIVRLVKRIGPELEALEQARTTALVEHAAPAVNANGKPIEGQYRITPAFIAAMQTIAEGATDDLTFTPVPFAALPVTVTPAQASLLIAAGLVAEPPDEG